MNWSDQVEDRRTKREINRMTRGPPPLWSFFSIFFWRFWEKNIDFFGFLWNNWYLCFSYLFLIFLSFFHSVFLPLCISVFLSVCLVLLSSWEVVLVLQDSFCAFLCDGEQKVADGIGWDGWMVIINCLLRATSVLIIIMILSLNNWGNWSDDNVF